MLRLMLMLTVLAAAGYAGFWAVQAWERTIIDRMTAMDGIEKALEERR